MLFILTNNSVNLYYISPPRSIWKIYVPDKCVFWNVHTISNNHDENYIGIDNKTVRWGSRWRVWCWFFSTLRKISSFLSLHLPRAPHEYYRRILAMFTIPHQDLELVNNYWPSWPEICGPIGKWSFSDDIVIKLATSLTMWYIWDLIIYFSQYELKTFCHRIRLVNYIKKTIFRRK